MRFAEVAPWVLSGAIVLCPPDRSDAATPEFGQAQITLDGKPAPPPSSSVCGFSLVASGAGPQIALTNKPPSVLVSLRAGEEAAVAVPIRGVREPFTVTARAALLHSEEAEVCLSLDSAGTRRITLGNAAVQLEVSEAEGAQGLTVRVATSVTT